MQQTLVWTQLYRDYAGQWVALKEDEETVVASGKLAKAVYSSAKEEGVRVPIMVRVPKISLPYVGQVG